MADIIQTVITQYGGFLGLILAGLIVGLVDNGNRDQARFRYQKRRMDLLCLLIVDKGGQPITNEDLIEWKIMEEPPAPPSWRETLKAVL